LEFVFAIIVFRVSVRIILVQIPTVFRLVIYSSADKTLIKAFPTSGSAISHFTGKVVPVAPLRRMLPPSCQVCSCFWFCLLQLCAYRNLGRMRIVVWLYVAFYLLPGLTQTHPSGLNGYHPLQIGVSLHCRHHRQIRCIRQSV
jgi:hypothetical protein